MILFEIILWAISIDMVRNHYGGNPHPASNATGSQPSTIVGNGRDRSCRDRSLRVRTNWCRLCDMPPINAIKLFDDMINTARTMKASDIQIEPRPDAVQVRMRVDGELHAERMLPAEAAPLLSMRIKVLSGMDTSQSRLPQDGRFSLHGLDLRVSTLPTLHGEKIVIRLLDPMTLILPLTQLGMTAPDIERYRAMIHLRQGMVIVTGPTGSGKTTTLYSSLQEVVSETKNIVTVEDPVEYQIASINQVQVNIKAGLTFPVALRAFLRQDPDILMVGEIRDAETAQIAIRAALTGHLVLSTMHTNHAAGAITRFLDMGIPAYLVAAALEGVVAQRLVRRPEGGRRGLFEVLPLSEEIKRRVKASADEKEIARIAIQEGMVSLEEQIAKLKEEQ